MSTESRKLAGMLLVIYPTVVIGGVSILSFLINDPQYSENPLHQDLWRAGHAHAGVFLLLSLVILRYIDEANLSLDIYVGLIAVFFTIFGVWMATKLVTPKVQNVVVEKEVYVPKPEKFTINETELKKLNLSSREYEVLRLLAKGYSNADIADNLFLSISTVKTHVSNLFMKMDVKSRTQAIEKGKRLEIIE